MCKFRGVFGILVVASLLAACGGKSTPTATIAASTARGTLVASPPLRIASLNAAGFLAQLSASTSGKQLIQLTGNPTCGVDFYYIKFWTVGGANEPTESSGALMVPTGGTGCSGPRPVVEYAHGTTTDKAYNIANIADPSNPANSEAALVAAMFAAQGYIVVAPNYAGYDISTLGYHPYLNAIQQADEMMDMLAAARAALPGTLSSATSDSGKLFLTGYSQGGYVAMATQRAMQAAKQVVTAAAPMSGPYALLAFGDAIITGHPDLGATVFTPLLTTSYQHAYGNIYKATTDLYTSTYAAGIDTLLPSTNSITMIFGANQLPQTAMFNPTPPTPVLLPPQSCPNPLTPPATCQEELALWALGFGTPATATTAAGPYLVNDSARIAYITDLSGDPDGTDLPYPATTPLIAAAAPVYPLRNAFYVNDLRNGAWTPGAPTLLCGGGQDPTVYYTNTQIMEGNWSQLVAASLVTGLDVDLATAGPTLPAFVPIQQAFQAAGAAEFAYLTSAPPAGLGLSPAAAQIQLIKSYHTSVLPFCAVAARSFFTKILGG